jgi:hypothetical protein
MPPVARIVFPTPTAFDAPTEPRPFTARLPYPPEFAEEFRRLAYLARLDADGREREATADIDRAGRWTSPIGALAELLNANFGPAYAYTDWYAPTRQQAVARDAAYTFGAEFVDLEPPPAGAAPPDRIY